MKTGLCWCARNATILAPPAPILPHATPVPTYASSMFKARHADAHSPDTTMICLIPLASPVHIPVSLVLGYPPSARTVPHLPIATCRPTNACAWLATTMTPPTRRLANNATTAVLPARAAPVARPVTPPCIESTRVPLTVPAWMDSSM